MSDAADKSSEPGSQGWSPAMPVGEDSIRMLVEAFYERVRQDPELGPVFGGAVHDWPAHLQTLTDFWSSVMLGARSYHGRPVPAHARHRDSITPELFLRWLALWRQTAQQLFAPDDAQLFVDKSELIARSLQYALFQQMPTPPRRPVA